MNTPDCPYNVEKCSFDASHAFRLLCPDERELVFCDSDCVRQWISDNHERSIAQVFASESCPGYFDDSKLGGTGFNG